MEKKVNVYQSSKWRNIDEQSWNPGAVVLQASRTVLVHVQNQEQADQLMALLAQCEVVEESYEE